MAYARQQLSLGGLALAMGGCTDEWMYGCTDGRMDGWANGRMGGCTCGRMDGRMQSIRPSVHPRIFPSVHKSVHASIRPPVHPFITNDTWVSNLMLIWRAPKCVFDTLRVVWWLVLQLDEQQYESSHTKFEQVREYFSEVGNMSPNV